MLLAAGRGRDDRDGLLEEGDHVVETRGGGGVQLLAGDGEALKHGGEEELGGADDEGGEAGGELEGGEEAGGGDEGRGGDGCGIGEELGVGDYRSAVGGGR